MNNIFPITLNILRVLSRKKINIILFILLPIIIISGIVSMVSFYTTTSIDVGVRDYENSYLSKDMINYIGDIDMINLYILNSDSNDETDMKKYQLILTIPQNYISGIVNNSTSKEINLSSARWTSTNYFVKQYLEFYISNIDRLAASVKYDPVAFKPLYNDYIKGSFDYRIQYLSNNNASYKFTQTAMGILLMFIMIAAYTASNIIIKEKREGTYNRIAMAPVSIKNYYMANIVVNLIILLIQIVSILFIMTALFNINIAIVGYFLLLVCFGLVSIGIGMFVVTTANSRITTALLPIIVTTTCMLGGCFWPSFIMPKLLQRIGLFVPQTWVIDGLMKLNKGEGLSSIIINLAVLILFTIVFFLLTVYSQKSKENIRYK